MIFSCKEEVSTPNENTTDVNTAERLLSKEFKNRLSSSPYEIHLRATEDHWITSKVLLNKGQNGYSNLLKKVIQNGFSDELVAGIYKAKSNSLNWKEFRVIFKENQKMLDTLPKDSSLFQINQLIKKLITSRNVTSLDISKSLLNGIQSKDLDNEFYQNIIILFYSSML